MKHCFKKLVVFFYGTEMRKSIFIWLFLLLFSGCATPEVVINSKTVSDFSTYRKIAVIRFPCNVPSVGQEASDEVALQLKKRGYAVADQSQLGEVINEKEIIHSGLTEKDRSALKRQGVDLLIMGSVARYECQESSTIFSSNYGLVGGVTNICHASMSLKIVNVQNGEILWDAFGLHSLDGGSMTADKVLQKVIKAMENRMPLIKQ